MLIFNQCIAVMIGQDAILQDADDEKIFIPVIA